MNNKSQPTASTSALVIVGAKLRRKMLLVLCKALGSFSLSSLAKSITASGSIVDFLLSAVPVSGFPSLFSSLASPSSASSLLASVFSTAEDIIVTDLKQGYYNNNTHIKKCRFAFTYEFLVLVYLVYCCHCQKNCCCCCYCSYCCCRYVSVFSWFLVSLL